MGFRELGFSLLIFVYLNNIASSYPSPETLPSEFMQNSTIEEKRINGSKVEGSSNHGNHGGKPHGNGNGNSASPNTHGTGAGAAVIPVYVAGAANGNHHHQTRHSAANCNLNKIKSPTMLMITLVNPLIELFLLS